MSNRRRVQRPLLREDYCDECAAEAAAAGIPYPSGPARRLHAPADPAKPPWRVTAVHADEEGPSFGYTAGLHEAFEHPELFLYGTPDGAAWHRNAYVLSQEDLGSVLNRVAWTVAAGRRLELGDEFRVPLDAGLVEAVFRVGPEQQRESEPAYLTTPGCRLQRLAWEMRVLAEPPP